ncbi:TPA: hypothetical protein ACGO7F_001801 [Streptococcus suis]
MKKRLSFLTVILIAVFSAFSVKADNADRAYEDNVRGFKLDIYSNYIELPLYSNAKQTLMEGYGINIYLKPGESWTIQPPTIPDFQVSSLERSVLNNFGTWDGGTRDLQLPLTIHYDDLQESLYTNSDGTVQIMDRFTVHMDNVNQKLINKLEVIVREEGDTEVAFEGVNSDYVIIAIGGQFLSFDDNYIPGKKITGFKFYRRGTLSKEFKESVPWDPEALGKPDRVVVYYGDPEESTFVNAEEWSAWDFSTIPGNNDSEETLVEETAEEDTAETTDSTDLVEEVVDNSNSDSGTGIGILPVLIVAGLGLAIYYLRKDKK